MKTLKVYFIFSIIVSLFVSCDLFFPYSLEDAPPLDTTNIDPPATDTTHTMPAELYFFFHPHYLTFFLPIVLVEKLVGIFLI